jgi:hypothetical protein
MDAIRFDALARSLVVAGSRRSLLAAASGVCAAFLARFSDEAAAGCKKVGKKCGKKKCCAGARCSHGRCRCKKGWSECNGDGLCLNLANDAIHCGACGQTCITGCCAGGACRTPCGGDCCADCFVESTGGIIQDSGTEACCAASSVCLSATGDPKKDRCCWPNEICIDNTCCCDGCEGTVLCDGKCCPSVACCNGKCCGAGQVCARPQANKPRKCVSADRSCTSDGDCFAGEECRGGTCCFGDRLCLVNGPDSDPVCCPAGEYCDLGHSKCCEIGKICSTSKKVRIRDN